MKKSMLLFLMVFMLLLTACTANDPNDAAAGTTEVFAEPTVATTAESYATEAPVMLQLPLPEDPVEFSFLSGAGAWSTVIILNRDGTFTGWFHDSEMGDVGEGYPHGSVYTCTFSGRFENIEMVNGYSYKMTLADLQTEKVVGEEWIENEIRYVAAEPHGLTDPVTNQLSTEFIFYLPDTPVDQVPEELLIWWPYRYDQESDPKNTLSCYGIRNVAAEFGFFTAE